MSRTPSKYVGQQLRVLRERRRWRQADLVAEFEQLGFPGWRQSKVAKIENGQAKRIPLKDIFESPPRSLFPALPLHTRRRRRLRPAGVTA